MNKPPKAAELVDYVFAQIATGSYPVGARIPSVRRMAAKFQLSYGTALRGIEFLLDSGALRKEGRGFLVAPQRQSAREYKRITVFLEPHVTERGIGLCHTAFMQMQELAYECDCHFFVVPVRGREITTELIRTASEGSHGIVMLNEYDAYFTELDTRLPVVGTLIHNSFGGKVSTVNLDPFFAARQAVAFFLSKNVRTVTISTAAPPVYMRRGEVFEAEFRRAGGTVKWDYDWLDEMHLGKGEGAYFTSDHVAEEHVATMEKVGVDLTRFPILSVDGKRTLMPSFHRFPTIAGDWKEIGRALFWEIYNRIRDPNHPVRSLYYEGRLTL